MVATHFYCPQCATVQPAALLPVLPGERSLGTSVECAACGYVVFIMIRGARIYCSRCDEIQPGLLKPIGAGRARALLCGACLDAKATLYEASTL